MINARASGHHVPIAVDPLAPAASLAVPAPAAAARPTLQELFDVHLDFVWRSVRRLGVPEANVDDAVQEVFLVTMRKLAGIEPGREKAFLFGTAVRVASGVRRTLRRRGRVTADDDTALSAAPSPAPGPDALLDHKRDRVLLDRCIDRLPEDLRVVFILHELEEMTAAAIADLLALPPGTVASRLRRARADFRAAVARLAEVRP